jgi:Raf kinase inhibitor-like YbhB/YbcL family protein
MSDDASEEQVDTGSSAARTITLLIIGLVLIGAVLAIVSIVGDGADDDAPGNSSAPTTEVTATDPPETDPPETEPPATDAPETTAPPETDPPETDPPETDPPVTDPPPADLSFTVGGIDDGQPIPRRFTCDGANEPPVITIGDVPEKTQQLAFLMEDPDAPDRTFVHWVAYGIAPDIGEFSDGRSDVTYGLNDVQLLDWFGPCPPEGDGPHNYTFTLFALDEPLDLEPGLDGRQLRSAIEPAVLRETSIVAPYER